MQHQTKLTRRQTLWMGLATLAGMGAIAARQGSSWSQQSRLPDASSREFTAVGPDPLKQRAQAKGFLYGAATSPPVLADAAVAAAFVQECSILVPENELKWQTLRPAPEQFEFGPGDRLLEFAQTHNLLLRGHTLVWEQALPDWFDETVSAQNAEQLLIEHITTVARHYAGRLHSWDVVNEAISASHSNRADSLSLSPWLQHLDRDYIDLAFQVAAAADPTAMLVYNDRWLDYDTPRDHAQRTAVLNLLARLRDNGTPIHALGIQAHLEGHETRFNPELLRAFLRDVASLGLKILITELDVTDHQLPADIVRRDRTIASIYEDYLSVVLDEPAVIAVLTWGLTDRHTWLNSFAPRPDGAASRPLPLDQQLDRKLAWNAMARAFDASPSR